ncbi:isoaspartyl peptidase/L-asparaginase-like isoform X2 [Acanthaster planci]|uniref:Isoaspartyl peptidase/L-asparaginase-like isoform X2 n=1 Tax=Acanthaster planci TaxID=133434 RepID=A0A8B7XSE3_ACAPL|nr:isoaspartyl peptidase/L-asparaginase-like isoform X2 [Acanthaster planci]XP_022083117.1 isoaspartyl peptidase/L-asparaginase-like isoform X2 [Acanthaster planci]
MMAPSPTLVIHGGAGALSHTGYVDVDGLKSGIQQAARLGYRHLVGQTSSAIDAVEAAVCSLEDNPLFNAGRGSVLTVEGSVEMDAIIMEGRDLQTGGVICVHNIKNPVSLARLVMEKTEHILLAGEGANKFAREMGLAELPSEEFITESRCKALKNHANFQSAVKRLYKDRELGIDDHDTVGAVAVDAHGNVAAATSTGGITAQMIGRVGDSPLIGSGAYCDNAVGAASTTGHGEAIAKVTLARNVVFYMEQGSSPQDALEKALTVMKGRLNSQGGAIAVSKNGDIGHYFNTEGMIWASVQNGQLHYGVFPGEDLVTMY